MTIDTAGNVGIGTASPTSQLHLKGTLSSALTGTVAVTAGTAAVTGTTTAFDTELAVGDSIKIGSEVFTVSAIGSATGLTLDSNHVAGASGATAYRNPALLAIDNGDAVNKLTVTRSGLLDLAGGLQAGSGNVGIVDSTGKIPAISSTYFANLSGANLTGITATTIPDGTDCSAGSYAQGIDGSGNASGCTADDDAPDSDSEVPDALTLASTAAASVTRTALGTTSTDGVSLINTTAAAAGAQQVSPRLRLTGQGWKTDATAASQTVDWLLQTVPVEGAAAPTSYLDFGAQVNAGGFGSKMTLTSAGKLDVAAGAQFGSGNVDLIDSTGKIAGISSTYFADLSGANLTSVTAANLVAASSVVADAEVDDTITASNYLPLAGGTMTGNLTVQKTDGALLLDASTAGDTDFWVANNNDAGGTDNDLFQIGDGLTVGTNPFLTIDTSGNVGIGTASPLGKLHVNGNIVVGTWEAADTRFWGRTQTDGSWGAANDGSSGIGIVNPGDGSHELIFRTHFYGTGANERMRIDKNGNVGIGTTGPDYLLHVSDAAETNAIGLSTTGITYVGTARPKRTIVLTAAGAIVPASNAPQQLQTNGTNVSYYTLNYSGAAAGAESAYWQFVVPDAYTGTTVNATLYWLTPSTTTTNAVKWFVDMNGLGDAQTLDAALQTAGTVTDNPTAVASQVLVTSEIATITTGWTAGEYAVVRVQRNAADAADTETGLAKLLTVKLEWTAAAESD